MPRRRSASSIRPVSWPSTVIVPRVGSIIRLTIRRHVVLPQPEGPTNTVILPVGAVSDRSSTAVVPSGNCLVTASNRIMGPLEVSDWCPNLAERDDGWVFVSRPRPARTSGAHRTGRGGDRRVVVVPTWYSWVVTEAPAFLDRSSVRGRRVLAGLTLGSGVAILDGSVVNVALRTMGRDLDASLAQLQWIVNGYLLALASLVLVGGALGDRHGRRRVYLVGVAAFAVASALCALAQTPGQLVALRVLQGVGAALLTPGALALIQASFRPEDRAAAIGTWAGLSGIAGALGPIVGGWIVDHASWRWIFAINVPLCIVVVLLTRRAVPESQDPSATGRFDVLGAAFTVLSLGAATYALTASGESGGSVVTPRVGGRGRECGRVPRRRTALGPPDGPPRDVPQPDLLRGQRDDPARLRRPRRGLPLRHPPAPGRRVECARGRPVGPADHHRPHAPVEPCRGVAQRTGPRCR